MSTFNASFFINAYKDSTSSNAPSRNNFRWQRDLGLAVTNPTSEEYSIPAGTNQSLVNGQRTINQDGTTEYSLTLKSGTTNTYTLLVTGGTQPLFRTLRAISGDGTTTVSVTVNGPVSTYTVVSGTPFSFAGVNVGDFLRVSTGPFNIANQGEFQIISKTTNSLSVKNENAVAEGPFQAFSYFRIYSAAGVQINDTLVISGGFSPVTAGSYVISTVSWNYLEFTSLETLPQEAGIVTDSIDIYSMAKKFIYLEASAACTISINGANPVAVGTLFASCSKTIPGLYMQTGTIFNLTVTAGEENVDVFFASVE